MHSIMMSLTWKMDMKVATQLIKKTFFLFLTMIAYILGPGHFE